MISVIIPICGDDENHYRSKAILETLDCLDKQIFTNFETILVEQHFEQDDILYDHLQDRVSRYIEMRSPIGRKFSISWCHNVGAVRANGELLVFLDCDLLILPDALQKVWDFYSEGKRAFVCWNSLFRLNWDGRAEWMENKVFENLHKDEMNFDNQYGTTYLDPRTNAATGGMVAFEKKFFIEDLHGYNERFFGWGYADNEVWTRAFFLTDEYYTLNNTIYHLPHTNEYKDRMSWEDNREIYKMCAKHPDKMQQEINKMEIGNTESPAPCKLPGIPKIYVYNLDVGSGIERAGNMVVEILHEYYPIEYRYQNPPCIMVKNLAQIKPDVIFINEYYPRIIKTVYHYQIYYPDTVVTLLNHCYDFLTNLPLDTEEDNPRVDRDGAVLVNYWINNEIDHIINLNHQPPDEEYPERFRHKVFNRYFPIHEKFTRTRAWDRRQNDFFYFGGIAPHKFSEEFVDKILGKKHIVEMFGRPPDGEDEYFKKITSSPNIRYTGFVPEEKLVSRLNSYRFMIVPHEGDEPFNLAIAEAIRCGCIPMIVNDRTEPNATWIDWAEGCYMEFQNVDDLIKAMDWFADNRRIRGVLDDFEVLSAKGAHIMRERTSPEEFLRVLRGTMQK